jgi:hypothetical protein
MAILAARIRRESRLLGAAAYVGFCLWAVARDAGTLLDRIRLDR